ncbi:MAG TPA: carboxylesterase family protein [Stellaceae bacterium]|jgi:para-nitrobenzyl esterase|nr:carboxylesterase family protein [Stellaceae bacterium]
MVWIYGGGLFSGESNDYDASKLAAKGDVIVVTFNYRIGALGFFSHPAINAEGHPFANYGIMDQQFALQWVTRNIAAFGGDPNTVTIFGQSGGGTAVMANLVSPKSAGLFQRAINESGTHIAPMPQEAAQKAAQAMAVAAGCADQIAACLRALPVEKIIASQGPNVASSRRTFRWSTARSFPTPRSMPSAPAPSIMCRSLPVSCATSRRSSCPK